MGRLATLVAVCGELILGAVSVAPWSTASAAAPQVGTQSARFYRFMLGHFQVTALSDG